MIIMLITRESVKLNGKMAYYTHAVIPLIAIVLIGMGIPVLGSVIIATIIPEPINYLFFLKKRSGTF